MQSEVSWFLKISNQKKKEEHKKKTIKEFEQNFQIETQFSKPNLQTLIRKLSASWMLLIKATSDWTFFLVVSSKPNKFGREIKNARSVSTSSLLKKNRTLFWNRELSPLFCESVRSLVRLTPHTCRCCSLWLVDVWTASIWLVEEISCILVLILSRWNAVDCVHIVVHTTFFLIVWLAHTIFVPCMSIIPRKKHISTNRPI